MARTKFGAAVKWGVIGAAATWFLDPQQGAERRQQLQDKVLGTVRKQKDELGERFTGSSTGTSGNGHGSDPLPDLLAEEAQLEPGAPGGPTVAPPTA